MAFRILSLDGGGTFCTVQARALTELYGDMPGLQVLENFDLVAATSGGSFVAAALAQNRSPREILALFHQRDKRERFFAQLPWYRRLPALLSGGKVGARFDAEAKRGLIGEITAEAGASEMRELWQAHGKRRLPHFLIVSYDYQFDKAKVFRSNPHSLAAPFPRRPLKLLLRDAVHASTHAPIRWFGGVARPRHGDHYGYWDGAMTGFNNPVLLALAEAIANGVAREDIRVLSIGTACTQLLPADAEAEAPYRIGKPRPGLFGDLGKAASAIIAEPPDIDSYLAHLMISQAVPQREGERISSPVVRMNPVIHPVHDGKRWGPPPGFDVDSFQRLVKLDISATADADVALIDRLCDGWIAGGVHNQSLRRRGNYFSLGHNKKWDEDLCSEVGELRFAEAKQAWLQA